MLCCWSCCLGNLGSWSSCDDSTGGLLLEVIWWIQLMSATTCSSSSIVKLWNFGPETGESRSRNPTDEMQTDDSHLSPAHTITSPICEQKSIGVVECALEKIEKHVVSKHHKKQNKPQHWNRHTYLFDTVQCTRVLEKGEEQKEKYMVGGKMKSVDKRRTIEKHGRFVKQTWNVQATLNVILVIKRNDPLGAESDHHYLGTGSAE